MKYFLAKTDPDTYSIDHLERDHITVWDGVRNPAAILAIKKWRIGDRVLIYHSQGETTIAGLAKVVSLPHADPFDATGKSWVAKIEHVKTYPVDTRVSLQEIKASGLFSNFALVRQSRLSTMECPETFITWLKRRVSV